MPHRLHPEDCPWAGPRIKTSDVPTAIVFVVRDGKVIEGREFFEDTAKVDDFWS